MDKEKSLVDKYGHDMSEQKSRPMEIVDGTNINTRINERTLVLIQMISKMNDHFHSLESADETKYSWNDALFNLIDELSLDYIRIKNKKRKREDEKREDKVDEKKKNNGNKKRKKEKEGSSKT